MENLIVEEKINKELTNSLKNTQLTPYNFGVTNDYKIVLQLTSDYSSIHPVNNRKLLNIHKISISDSYEPTKFHVNEICNLYHNNMDSGYIRIKFDKYKFSVDIKKNELFYEKNGKYYWVIDDNNNYKKLPYDLSKFTHTVHNILVKIIHATKSLDRMQLDSIDNNIPDYVQFNYINKTNTNKVKGSIYKESIRLDYYGNITLSNQYYYLDDKLSTFEIRDISKEKIKKIKSVIRNSEYSNTHVNWRLLNYVKRKKKIGRPKLDSEHYLYNQASRQLKRKKIY